MGEPAIVSLVSFLVVGGVAGWVTTQLRQREQRAERTQEWIDYLQQDLVA